MFSLYLYHFLECYEAAIGVTSKKNCVGVSGYGDNGHCGETVFARKCPGDSGAYLIDYVIHRPCPPSSRSFTSPYNSFYPPPHSSSFSTSIRSPLSSSSPSPHSMALGSATAIQSQISTQTSTHTNTHTSTHTCGDTDINVTSCDQSSTLTLEKPLTDSSTPEISRKIPARRKSIGRSLPQHGFRAMSMRLSFRHLPPVTTSTPTPTPTAASTLFDELGALVSDKTKKKGIGKGMGKGVGAGTGTGSERGRGKGKGKVKKLGLRLNFADFIGFTTTTVPSAVLSGISTPPRLMSRGSSSCSSLPPIKSSAPSSTLSTATVPLHHTHSYTGEGEGEGEGKGEGEGEGEGEGHVVSDLMASLHRCRSGDDGNYIWDTVNGNGNGDGDWDDIEWNRNDREEAEAEAEAEGDGEGEGDEEGVRDNEEEEKDDVVHTDNDNNNQDKDKDKDNEDDNDDKDNNNTEKDAQEAEAEAEAESALYEAAEYFIPLPALRAIYSGSLNSIAELRQVTTLFLNLDSYLPEQNHDPITLQSFFYLLQQILSETGGFLRQFLVDDKVSFLCFY